MSAALPVMINGKDAARIKHPGKISGYKCKQGSGVGGICSGDFFKFKFHFSSWKQGQIRTLEGKLPDQLAPVPCVEPFQRSRDRAGPLPSIKKSREWSRQKHQTREQILCIIAFFAMHNYS